MTADDYNEVYSLWCACGLVLDDTDSRAGITRLLQSNPGLSFVVEENGVVIGTVVGSFDGRRGWVRHVAVSPSHQGRGLGAALLTRLEEAFRSRNVSQISLHVHVDNAGVTAFYGRLGWTRRHDVILMTKRLT
jgi:ribosomal protein S18 acetylase RimI-like enzyme